ncbi:MAG TPA: hypothetical protein VFM93_00635 [Candidatus Limnocylindria bacterium]|nr:hypothetical protein [Candidatus Limnocylindria bacterium]
MARPVRISLVMYQVGFGDCFLLTFHYATMARHVLIDMGTTGLPKTAPAGRLLQVAEDVRARTGGHLDGLVVSHRHADHISGFARGSGRTSGSVIASLRPSVVVQPWTEDPRARPNAKRPVSERTGRTAFTTRLDEMHRVAELALAESRTLGAAEGKAFAQRLAFLGETNLKNAPAVRSLMRLGRVRSYVSFGGRTGLESVLPGVKVHVLGPPTLEQSEEIRKQRRRDEDEFWHLLALTGLATPRAWSAGARSLAKADAPSTRWFRERLRALRAESLLELVRILDKAMNNTSVILLFETGDQKLLFPGDAQIENWQYALSKERVRRLLADVTLYKVGHHGSLNATPKTLWELFDKRSRTPRRGRLISVVSTMGNKHGSSTRDTEVPRIPLVEALKERSEYHTSQTIRSRTTFWDEIELTVGG